MYLCVCNTMFSVTQDMFTYLLKVFDIPLISQDKLNISIFSIAKLFIMMIWFSSIFATR